MRLPLLSRNPREFGSCCKDLKDAMTVPPNSMLRVTDWGVLYLTVGYVQTDEGMHWMDQAVLFCPFCGKQLQSPEEVRAKALQIQRPPQ